jgi:hypothetical protein
MGEQAEVDEFEIIRRIETERLALRRTAWGLEQGEPIGLVLSGGGIRSATFSLGVLRELSALRVLHRFDYLATVSGGAYAGAFFCGLFIGRAGAKPILKADPSVEDPLATSAAQDAIKLLRESGRYLAPAGGLDYWYALVILIRNWLGLHLILGSIVFSAGLLGIGLRFLAAHGPDLAIQIAGTSLSLWGGVNEVSNALDVLFRGWLSFGPSAAAALAGLALCFSFGWAYWLTRRDLGSRAGRAFWAVFSTAMLVLLCLFMGPFIGPAAWVPAILGIIALLLWLKCLIENRIHGRAKKIAGATSAFEQEWDARRLWLTRLQAKLLRASALLALFSLADAIGYALATQDRFQRVFLGFPALSALVVPLSRFLLGSSKVSQPLGRIARRLPSQIWLKLLAAALVALLVLFWETLAYWLAWNAQTCFPSFLWGSCGFREAFSVALAVTLILWIGIAGTPSLLNLTSLATFYAGRLRRAYLGAGNPRRQAQPKGVDQAVEGDDMSLKHYYAANATPLHLISVTLNQTRGSGSNIVERDRHGRNIAVGPAGIAVSLERTTGCKLIGFDAKHENLPLSAWVGISGAAFSTGAGTKTGFGLSTLAGLSNVRLGYWWRAGEGGGDRPVQVYLIDELRGAFPGTRRARWYLSDGGHFDNSAIYELLRRRVRFIFASDNGHDRAYAYEDIAGLVRKARIDFGSEISFLEAKELDACLGARTPIRRRFGTLAQIGGLEPLEPGAVAALARVEYPDCKPGTLVLLKPRLTGDGPIDLIRYKEENSDFPQQPTFDQFFDEAQWESYYTLGRLLTRLVMAPAEGPWCPAKLSPFEPKARKVLPRKAGGQAGQRPMA